MTEPSQDNGGTPPFNAAAGIPRPGAPSFAVQLLQAATAGDWQGAQRLLDDNKSEQLPYSISSAEILRRAAHDGETGILAAVFARGFAFPSPIESDEMLEHLIRNGSAAAVRSAGFLLQNKLAAPQNTVLRIARDGTPDIMERLRRLGVDITADGLALPLAFQAGNLEMMRFLHNYGANLYHPSIVAGLHGRRDNFRAQFGGPETDDVTAFYRRLIRQDQDQLAMYCAYVWPDHPTMDKLREVPYGLIERDMTMLQLMARSGEIEEIIKIALHEDKAPLTLDDVLRQDRDGTSLLSILAARGEEKKLLDARLWLHSPKTAADVNEALKDLRAGQILNPDAYEQDLRYARLRKKADPARWSLTPRRRRPVAGDDGYPGGF